MTSSSRIEPPGSATTEAPLPCALFFFRKNGRLRLKYFLPRTVREYVGGFASDVYVDRIVALGSLYIVAEFKCERFGRLAEPPRIRFAGCKARTVDARLLPRTDTDRLPVFDKGDAVRLRILEYDERN